jgi:RNA-directed DNA polymerase
MTLDSNQKSIISPDLRSALTILDLAKVINKVIAFNNTDSENETYYYTEKSLKYRIYGKSMKTYKTFTIPKKSGGTRTILAPNKERKFLQKIFNICLQSLYTPFNQAHGFIPKRSIVTNAKVHTNKKYVYNIDLKDFFPSISYHRVNAVLTKVKQFNLDPFIASIISNVCCHDGYLPQGAPTSPTLSNFVCISLDVKLYKLSTKLNFTYTRYADDITISCNEDIFTEVFKSTIFNIIKEEGFYINPAKERMQINNVLKDGILIRQKQEVTGITVNKKTNVSQKYIRQLKATLYNWEKHGYQIASMLHEHFYKFSKGAERNPDRIPRLELVVSGRIEYLKMVKGAQDTTYLYFKMQYDSLCMKEAYSNAEIDEILQLWQENGINAAMNRFYDKRNLVKENLEIPFRKTTA